MFEKHQRQGESNFVRHTNCVHCGSKDNCAEYDDGHTFCFGCHTYTSGEGEIMKDQEIKTPSRTEKNLIYGDIAALSKREISEATCRKFGYEVGEYQGRPVQIANYRNDHGEIVAQKIRDANKNFTILGDAKEMGLFGQHLWTTGKKLIVCEGEIDCLSVSQVQRNKYPVVSLPNGAQSSKKALMRAWDWLDGFAEIILMFDQDEAGQKAALECAEALPVGKVKIAKLAYKDANEALQKGAESEIIDAIWRAKDWRPDGIVSSSDLLEEVLADDDESSTVSYPYPKLNEITKGIRPATLVTICAGSGVGKSTLVSEIAYHLHTNDQKIGMLMLEESELRTMRGIYGLHLNKNIVQDASCATKDEVRAAHDELFREHDVQLFKHFGSTSLEIICNRIQYMVKAMGCTHIILDHISIVVSGLTGGVTDERRLIDHCMTVLRQLVQELNITLFLVSHLTRPQGVGHEAGGKVSLSQLRGSHSLAQLSDQCIGMQVNPDDPTDDTRDLVVLKNRFTGQVGWAGRLKYHRDTGRLIDANFDDVPF